jgi:hypothetical protein
MPLPSEVYLGLPPVMHRILTFANYGRNPLINKRNTASDFTSLQAVFTP